MHGFWSKKRANDNAPSLSSDDSRDESLSSPTSSIAKFAEKNSVPTSVVITSSSNALPIARLNRKQTQPSAPTDNVVQPSVPSSAPPEIPQYETDEEPKEKIKRRKLESTEIVNILAAFDIEVDALVRRIEVDSEAHASTLRNSLQVELIKLPQKIRKMPIKQFLSEQSLPTTIKKDLRTVQFDRDIKSPFATPKARPIAPNSAVKVSAKKPISANIPDTPSGAGALSFQLENGEQIDSTDLLSDASRVNTMSKKARQDALLQLQQLQEQVNSLMSVLKR